MIAAESSSLCMIQSLTNVSLATIRLFPLKRRTTDVTAEAVSLQQPKGIRLTNYIR